MNEQEAEAYAARLTRIWKPENGLNISTDEAGCYEFVGQLNPLCSLFVRWLPSRIAFGLSHETDQGPRTIINLRTDRSRYYIVQSPSDKTLAQEHLAMFRRNCWLSGCPIEATAHEKAEWMQGFTHEELEAWNLKT